MRFCVNGRFKTIQQHTSDSRTRHKLDQHHLAKTRKDKIDETALYELARAKKMPEEIFDVDKFIQIAERAEYCNIKRLDREVKLKLRTPKRLYTLKVNPTKAEEIIKKLSCEIREV